MVPSSNRLLVALFATLVSGSAHATILTFTGPWSASGSGTIEQSYGDNVNFGSSTSGTNGTGSYSRGTAWTPNVTVAYESFDSNGLTTPFVNTWGTGYGNRTDVIYAQTTNYAMRVILTPDAGFSVKINSFRLAGYPNTAQTSNFVRVRDLTGNNLWSATNLNASGTSSTLQSPNLTFAGPVQVEVGNNWNVGMDDLNFDQVAVPEPSSLAFLAVGFAALLRRRRR